VKPLLDAGRQLDSNPKTRSLVLESVRKTLQMMGILNPPLK
jgi:hypothetical protein